MNLDTEYEHFWDKGYLVVRKAFLAEEMLIIKKAITQNGKMKARFEEVLKDIKTGKKSAFSTIFVWNDTSGDDIFSIITRSNKIFDRLEFFFKDEVYDYHNKVPLKYPGMIGFPYHQDYAYWYGMGNIYPDMATTFIALDPAHKNNGCLKIIEGSHKLGRVDHIGFDGVEPARLDEIRKRIPETVVELDTGDMVIFHANTIHGSEDNNSNLSRLALIGTYNTKHNDPYAISCGHPKFIKQKKFMRPLVESDIDKLPDFDMNYYDCDYE